MRVRPPPRAPLKFPKQKRKSIGWKKAGIIIERPDYALERGELLISPASYYEKSEHVALMARNNEGLTKTYNRFHDPNEGDPDILKLRDLHAAMDRAVLEAYGWGDIPTGCEFLLDYEVDEDEAGSRRKKPWRCRWPDPVRDEVLARLLDLNAGRPHIRPSR